MHAPTRTHLLTHSQCIPSLPHSHTPKRTQSFTDWVGRDAPGLPGEGREKTEHDTLGREVFAIRTCTRTNKHTHALSHTLSLAYSPAHSLPHLQIGWAVIHRGSQMHGARPLSKGRRTSYSGGGFRDLHTLTHSHTDTHAHPRPPTHKHAHSCTLSLAY